MNLLDLSHFERFRFDKHVKVLRHKSQDDLWQLRRDKKFHIYQNEQAWDAFGNARYVISFIAEHHRYAKFIGVWEIISKRQKGQGKSFHYRTKELPGFEELEDRLIVRWGEGTRSWTQWLHRQGNKEIVAIVPRGQEDFPGFYNVVVPYSQLVKIVNNPDANRNWRVMLSSVSGVYLILDTRSGKQYVGSAYGEGGIWARWGSYAKSAAGGNMLLKRLLKKSPKRYKHFQFSVLRVLEPTATSDDVIAQEVLTKLKLGSRAFGLNSN